MTRTLALAALLALAACGDDAAPPPPTWTPPVVDLDRLGVACPAPEVPVTVWDGQRSGCGIDLLSRREVPASEVQPGMWVGSSINTTNLVTEIVVIENAQRLRLVLEDGREGIFTADHGFFVHASDDAAYFWPLYQLRPGDRVVGEGFVSSVVADVQTAPDGPVVQIKALEDRTAACYTGSQLDALTMGLVSLIHTERSLPIHPRPDDL